MRKCGEEPVLYRVCMFDKLSGNGNKRASSQNFCFGRRATASYLRLGTRVIERSGVAGLTYFHKLPLSQHLTILFAFLHVCVLFSFLVFWRDNFPISSCLFFLWSLFHLPSFVFVVLFFCCSGELGSSPKASCAHSHLPFLLFLVITACTSPLSYRPCWQQSQRTKRPYARYEYGYCHCFQK